MEVKSVLNINLLSLKYKLKAFLIYLFFLTNNFVKGTRCMTKKYVVLGHDHKFSISQSFFFFFTSMCTALTDGF